MTVTIVTIVCIVHIVYQLLSQDKTSQDLFTPVQVFSVCSIQIYFFIIKTMKISFFFNNNTGKDSGILLMEPSVVVSRFLKNCI